MYSEIVGALKDKNEELAELVQSVDDYIFNDNKAMLFYGRRLAEKISVEIAKIEGIYNIVVLSQLERLKELKAQELIEGEIEDAFHSVRKIGNTGVHGEIDGELLAALTVHKYLYKILCWYIEVYGDPEFISKPYKEPKPSEKNINQIESVQKIIKEEVERAVQNFRTSSLEKQILEDVNNQQKTDEVLNKTVNAVAITSLEDVGACNVTVEMVEDILNNVNVKPGGSPTIVCYRELLKRFISEERWQFSNGDGSITIYNKNFRELVKSTNIKFEKVPSLQFWVTRPEKEKFIINMELISETKYKELRLELAQSLKKKFKYNDNIILKGEGESTILSYKIDLIGIKDKGSDTVENVNKNSMVLAESIKELINYFDENMVESWVEKEAQEILFNNLSETHNTEIIVDKLPLVSTINQITDNIIKFNSEIEIYDSLQRKLSTFVHWYYYEEKDMFGPSKFIGYVNNNAKAYEKGSTGATKYMRGTDSERVIKRMKIAIIPTGEEMDKLYNKLESIFKGYDKAPKETVVIHKIVL